MDLLKWEIPWIFPPWLAASTMHLDSQEKPPNPSLKDFFHPAEERGVLPPRCVHTHGHTPLDSLFLMSPFHLLVSFEGSGYLASGNIWARSVIYHNCNSRSYNFPPEGLLQTMSSHLYLWQLQGDLVQPHFDKSHLELINMGGTLPSWLRF